MSIHVKSYVMTLKADIANLSADNMLKSTYQGQLH